MSDGRLIASSELSRLVAGNRHWIHNQAKSKTLIGRVTLGGKTYYRIEYAKKLVRKLKYMSEQEYQDIDNQLDNYRP